MLSFFLIASALAGKLQDDNGFRGKQFGPASVLDEAPMEGCVKNPEKGVLWSCKTTLGEHTIQAHYLVQEDLFTSMILTAEGYTTCYGIKNILSIAWGDPIQLNPYIEEYQWRDLPVLASWEFNKFDDTCLTFIMNTDVYQTVKDREQERAKAAVGDL